MSKLQVEIKKSCHQQWSDMKVMEGCRFCESCQKKVYDFRQMDAHQIRRHHQGTQGQLCGIYDQQQIEVLTPQMPVRPSLKVLRKWGIAVWGLLLAELSYGQLASDSTKVEQTEKSHAAFEEEGKLYSYHGGLIREEKTDSLFVKGKVIELETGEPLIFANVLLRGYDIASTDFDGNFSMNVTKAMQENEEIKMEVSYIGFQKKEVIISRQQFENNDTLQIDLKMLIAEYELDEIALVGEVVVIKQPFHIRAWQGIRRFFSFKWMK